jgi:hypothetical protein
MRKITKNILAVSMVAGVNLAIANSGNPYEDFQKFNNQISVGVSFAQSTLANGAAQQALQQSQFMSFDAEHQFNNGIWANLNAYMMTSTNSLGNQAVGTGMGFGQPGTQQPNVGGFNAKVGYAYPLDIASQKFMLTPYGILGRNTNLAMSTILSNEQINITNDYFITAGVGVRAQYIVNKYVNVYFDQAWTYNWDQSGPAYGIMPQNNQAFTTTLGAKYNVWQQLQLGLAAFYNNYQYSATAPAFTTIGASGQGPSGGGVNGNVVSIYQPQYDYGMMFSVGMTF